MDTMKIALLGAMGFVGQVAARELAGRPGVRYLLLSAAPSVSPGHGTIPKAQTCGAAATIARRKTPAPRMNRFLPLFSELILLFP